MKANYKFSNICGTVYRQGNVLFTPDGNTLYSPVGNRVSVFDLVNNKSFTFPFENRKNIAAIALSPDGNVLVSVDEDGRALLVNARRGAVLHHFNFKQKVKAIKFSPDGKYIAVTHGSHVQVWGTPNHLVREFAPFNLHRTYTGHHDDLGVQEAQRQQLAAEQRLVSGDESLRGLGIAGVHNKHGASSTISMHTSNGYGHVKPETTTAASNPDAQIYDSYYADLERQQASNPSSAPTSAMPTPSATAPSNYSLDMDEEEDRKPSIKMLDSLSEYRKRSRSIDDVGTAPKTPKIAKTDSSSSVAGLVNGFNEHLPAQFATPDIYTPPEPVPMQSNGIPPADEPLVYVNGNPKPLSLVTEEDHDLMTPEEYTAYFEVLEAQG
ncbi:hypothetical protein NMY22_g19888 [Coprinellus aureogranulatus]|nr:hypothetical protein NMY22_g19888 [Coprinellus aureogranulatus]